MSKELEVNATMTTTATGHQLDVGTVAELKQAGKRTLAAHIKDIAKLTPMEWHLGTLRNAVHELLDATAYVDSQTLAEQMTTALGRCLRHAHAAGVENVQPESSDPLRSAYKNLAYVMIMAQTNTCRTNSFDERKHALGMADAMFALVHHQHGMARRAFGPVAADDDNDTWGTQVWRLDDNGNRTERIV
jgi:hypothetical protein